MTLSDRDIERFVAAGHRMADAAGRAILPHFRKPLDIENKAAAGSYDPVTIADRAAERAIREIIEADFPDHGIVGEEFGIKQGRSAFSWTLDPIDGTRAFVSGLPLWGTLIALTVDGSPVIGFLDQPYLKERYIGTPGGSFVGNQALKTSSLATLDQATISTTGINWFTEEEQGTYLSVERACRMVRYGYDCYAYAMVASGFIHTVMEAGLQSYDCHALIPIVQGAGGVVSNWQGENPDKGGQILASANTHIHRQVLDVIAQS